MGGGSSGPASAHVVVEGDRAWIAYPRETGTTYEGKEDEPQLALAAAAALLAELRDLGSSVRPGDLPVVAHRPERWSDFFERLTGGDDTLVAPLGAPARRALDRRAADIRELVASVVTLPVPARRRLVHNDLQHANVLMTHGEAVFLDLEDLCLEHPAVAGAHAIFKLLRHAVYMAHAGLDRVREALLPQALRSFAAAGVEPGSLEAFLAFGAWRICSDVFEIHAWGEERADTSQVYDYEKRVANLLELLVLSGR